MIEIIEKMIGFERLPEKYNNRICLILTSFQEKVKTMYSAVVGQLANNQQAVILPSQRSSSSCRGMLTTSIIYSARIEGEEN